MFGQDWDAQIRRNLCGKPLHHNVNRLLACYTLALQDIERYDSMQRFCHTVPTASYIRQHFDAFCMPMFAPVTFHAC